MKNSDRKVQVMFFGPFSQKGGQPFGILCVIIYNSNFQMDHLVLSRFFFLYYTKNRNSFPEKVPAFIPQILRSSLTS